MSGAANPTRRGFLDGGAFILDAPPGVPAVWGEGEDVAWSEGEPCIIVAPPGLGKTTLAGQLALCRIDIGPSELLGMPVARSDKPVLYIAADRPRQAARSLRRTVNPDDRPKLEQRLIVWQGPPPFDVAAQPDQLAEFVTQKGAGTLIIDSLKDVAMDLVKDEAGARLNKAIQLVIAAGVEVLILHHQRKQANGSNDPRKLDDVYGSAWITAGAGSVLFLAGEAGDAIVTLKHLKQPAGDIGPLRIIHDHRTGTTRLHEGLDAYGLLQLATGGGITARDLAERLYNSSAPNLKEKARRKLDELVTRGLAVRVDGDRHTPTLYRPVHHPEVER